MCFAGRNICIAGASLKIVSPSDKELIQFVTKCTKKVDEDGAVTKGIFCQYASKFKYRFKGSHE